MVHVYLIWLHLPFLICLAEIFQMIANNVGEISATGHCDYKNPEDCAIEILRHHYGTLSLSLQYPISVAQLLHKEQVISQRSLTIIKFTAQTFSKEEAIFLLLKAIRHATRNNYRSLEGFASVLLKFTSNAPCANSILKDFGKYNFTDCMNTVDFLIVIAFPGDDIPEEQPGVSEGNK